MGVRRLVTAVGFWVGALLPFLYLPVFVFGIDSIARLSLILALIAFNALALVVGHDYPDTRTA